MLEYKIDQGWLQNRILNVPIGLKDVFIITSNEYGGILSAEVSCSCMFSLSIGCKNYS